MGVNIRHDATAQFTHQLLPIPPELRNAVYDYATTAPNVLSTAASPFDVRIYDTSHTKVSVALVSPAANGLLALADYLDAAEYKHHVLHNHTHMLITILFKGHLDTFIPAHFDKKISASMAKLIKKHPFIAKLPKWEVTVHWSPKTDSIRRVKDRNVAPIVNSMVESLLRFQSHEVRKTCGEVVVRLHLSANSLLHTWLLEYPRMMVGGARVWGAEDFLMGFIKGQEIRDPARLETREIVAQYIHSAEDCPSSQMPALEEVSVKERLVDMGALKRAHPIVRRVVEHIGGGVVLRREAGSVIKALDKRQGNMEKICGYVYDECEMEG